MEKFSLKDMIKGWFIGSFDLTAYNTTDFEVAIKRYKKGDMENPHTHKLATEITVIVEGEVLMNDVKYGKDDIIIIPPNEYTDFECIKDTITVVVKTPSALGDKYLK